MDGVIIDSEPIHFESDMLTMKYYNNEISYEELFKFVGISNPEMWKIIKKNFNMNVSIEELVNRQFDYKINLFSSKKLEAIDGILELINEIQKKNIKIAISSSSSKKIIELILSNLKLLKKFDVIVSGEEVLHGKPEPDIFLETAKQLKVQTYN
jgi:beta-phosphoglucomutase-like phosphatase (HAD superfamily)